MCQLLKILTRQPQHRWKAHASTLCEDAQTVTRSAIPAAQQWMMARVLNAYLDAHTMLHPISTVWRTPLGTRAATYVMAAHIRHRSTIFRQPMRTMEAVFQSGWDAWRLSPTTLIHWQQRTAPHVSIAFVAAQTVKPKCTPPKQMKMMAAVFKPSRDACHLLLQTLILTQIFWMVRVCTGRQAAQTLPLSTTARLLLSMMAVVSLQSWLARTSKRATST